MNLGMLCDENEGKKSACVDWAERLGRRRVDLNCCVMMKCGCLNWACRQLIVK